MKIKWLITLSLVMAVQLLLVNTVSAQYKYNVDLAKKNYAILQNNSECRSAIRALGQYGLKEAETTDVISKLSATDPAYLSRIAESGIAQLKNRKYISATEHTMLRSLFKKEGPSEKEYQAFKAYSEYSSSKAESIFKFIQEEAPEYTAQGGGRWKRIKGWIRDHIIHLAVGTISAIAGGISGGPLGAIGGFISGWKSVNKVFKNAMSTGGGNGFMAQANGAGCDGTIPYGWPF